MKSTLYSVHKWLALVFALPFIVSALTGLVMTLETRPEPLKASNAMVISVPDVLQKLKDERPAASITRVNFSDRTVTAYLKTDEMNLVTVDRADGTIISEVNPMKNIFMLSKMVHETFFMKSTGKIIVAICGFALTLVVLSGFFFWAKRKFAFQVKSLYFKGKLTKLKDLHLMVGLIVLLPLLYAGGTGFLIELNKLFWSDNSFEAHTVPTSCSFDQQIALLRNVKLDGGRINFCRPDYPYLTYINKEGSREFTPDGVVAQTVARTDWKGNFYFRKHHFVHLHGGDDFGAFKTPYRLLLSAGLLLLNFTGLFLWWKKRKGRLSANLSFDISNSTTLTKAI